jgi:cobalt/nickel transport system permease protein
VAFLDRYRAGDSALHRADTRVKLATCFAYVLAITFTRPGDWWVLAALAAPLLLLALASRLGLWALLRRAFLALPFVAAALPLLFTMPGETLFTVPVTGWTASREGAVHVGTIMARSWLAVAAGVLLVSTTPVVDLLRALRAFRVPPLLTATLFFAYRYAFVIGDEAQRMLRARAARSALAPGLRGRGSLGWRARVTGAMVGSLFTRSLDRSDRVFAAMQARGYRGELLSLEPPAPPLARVSSGAHAGVLLAGYGALVQLAARLS